MVLPQIEIYFELICENSEVDNVIYLISNYSPIKSCFREISDEEDVDIQSNQATIVGTAQVRFRSYVGDAELFLKNIPNARLSKFQPEYPKFFSPAVRRVSLTTGLIVGLAILAHHIIVFFQEMKLGHEDYNILGIDIATAIFAGFIAFVLEIISTYRERD